MSESKTAGGLRAELDDLQDRITSLRKDRVKAMEEGSATGVGGGAAETRMSSVGVKRILKGHFGKVYACHWAGDANHTTVSSAAQDGKLILWDTISNNKLDAIALKSSWVMTCALEPTSCNLAATGGLDNICTITDVSSQTKKSDQLSDHDGYISCARFIPGGNAIITSSGDSTCKVWDISRRKVTETFEFHTGDVMSVSLSPTDPNVFASGSCDSTVQVWDIRERSKYSHFARWQCSETGAHESDINSVDFMSNGMSIATGSDDSTCKLWDLRAPGCVGTYGGDKVVEGITSVALSKGGQVLFAGYDGDTMLPWDVMSGATLKVASSSGVATHDNRVSCLGVSHQGHALCTGSWDTMLKIWA